MKIIDIANLLKAKIVCGRPLENMEVSRGFASDLMSDVLTLDTDKLILITGLANVQTICTSEMADIQCILFVRDKQITQEMIDIAVENEMILLQCKYSMYRTVGELYKAGLEPVY